MGGGTGLKSVLGSGRMSALQHGGDSLSPGEGVVEAPAGLGLLLLC